MEGEPPSTHGEVRGCTLTIEYSVSPDDTAGEYAFSVCQFKLRKADTQHAAVEKTLQKGAGTGRRGQITMTVETMWQRMNDLCHIPVLLSHKNGGKEE